MAIEQDIVSDLAVDSGAEIDDIIDEEIRAASLQFAELMQWHLGKKYPEKLKPLAAVEEAGTIDLFADYYRWNDEMRV